jgi:hypothetical protein
MKPSVAYLGVLASCVMFAVPALAQESPGAEQPPGSAAPFVQPQIQGQVGIDAAAVPAAQGEWVDQGDGPVWVPAGATAYTVGSQPYVYLYTPVYGWGWYHSPWGWGAYSRGPWLSAHWGRGWRVGPGVRWASPHAAFGHYAGVRGGVRGFYGGGFHGAELRGGEIHGGGFHGGEFHGGGFHGGEFHGAGGFHGGGFHGGGFHGGGFHGRR